MNRNVTPREIKITIVTLAVILVPLISGVIFPDSALVQLLFSNGRVIIFWAVLFILVACYEYFFEKRK